MISTITDHNMYVYILGQFFLILSRKLSMNILKRINNSPFYSCVLSNLAFEWNWGCSWPCFDKDRPCFSHVNHVVLMLTSLYLHMKSRRICISARSTPASLPLKGPATKQRTVKWTIHKEKRNSEEFYTGGRYSLNPPSLPFSPAKEKRFLKLKVKRK